MKLNKSIISIILASSFIAASASALAETAPMPMTNAPQAGMPMMPMHQQRMGMMGNNPEMMQRMMQMRQERMAMMNNQGGNVEGSVPGTGQGMPMMQMMHQRQAMMQAHMTKMETHLANIESLLAKLVELHSK